MVWIGGAWGYVAIICSVFFLNCLSWYLLKIETQATRRKEAIQREIEGQVELGTAGLLKEDHWMMEVILGDMESYSVEQGEYWLVAIKDAREAATLTRQQGNQAPAELTADGL